MSSQTFSEMCEEAAERLYLEHHGIKGQKWGVLRWSNPDGTLNAAGRERYGVGTKRGDKEAKKLSKLAQKSHDSEAHYTDRGTYKKANWKTQANHSKLLSSPQLKDALKRAGDERAEVAAAQTRVEQISKDFYNNKDGLFSKYQDLALKDELNRLRRDFEDDGYDEAAIQRELKTYEHEFKYGDADQEYTFNKWLHSGEPSAKEFVKAMNDKRAAEKAYEEKLESYISEFTGEFGKQPVDKYGFSDVDGYLARLLTRYS